jgi:LPXTG-motif cell wall-anchored protein
MRKLIAVLVAFGLLSFVLVSPASAHTPSISATCEGVVLKASAYDGNKTNKWSVTIDGETKNGTFGASLNKTFDVPQGGKTTQWSATIQAHDGSFKESKSGSVGPCGDTPPKPKGHNVTCEVAWLQPGRALVNGDHINIDVSAGGTKLQVNAYVDRNIAGGYDTLGLRLNTPDGQKTIPRSEEEVKSGRLTFNFGQYLSGYYEVEWVQFNSSYFNQDRDPSKFLKCGEPPKPNKPEVIVEKKHEESAPNCELKTVTITFYERTTDWSFDESKNEWVKGNPSEWQVVKTDTRTATEQECPAPEVVINPTASVEVLCDGTGTAILDNSKSTTQVGFEVVVNGVATLYSVPADTVETRTLSGAQPGSQVIVQDGEANKLTSATVPDKCDTPVPPKPKPVVTEASSTSYECGEDFQTIKRTVTTTDWVFDEKTSTWVEGEPITESFTETVAVDVVPCATSPEKPTPPVSDTSKVTPPTRGVLPNTGGPELMLGLLGLLMIAGGGLLAARRHRMS